MENSNKEIQKFDKTYKENPDMFGHPYQELQDYFTAYPAKSTLLDVGCGQGRDALFLAELGYDVTALDQSQVAVDQMIEKAKEKNLSVTGIVGDVLTFDTKKAFDIILFDMILHAFGESQQKTLLEKFAGSLQEKGIFCIVYPDDMTTDYFMNILKSLPYSWKLLDEIVVKDVPTMKGEDADYTFMMIVVQLVSTQTR